MVLPAELLQAVSAPGGGRIALVIGAGCSIEPPTCVPDSRACSEEVYRRLVADGVLQNGDCTDPSDLSLVADAVFAKKNSQHDVVERLCDQYDLKLATANHGYLIAAAMLFEAALCSVVTLNFDLALSTALSDLGAGQIVGVVECPAHLPRQKTVNVYYLHRNANAEDPESWVLRTAALKEDWKEHWEQIIATRVLAAPVVVFAGLGTPVAVLIESAKLLRNALPNTRTIYQVDPANIADSKFFQELVLGPSAYIQLGWGQFMEELAQRLSVEQIAGLEHAVAQKVHNDRLPQENLAGLLASLRALGLVKLGKLRGYWLLYDRPYCPASPDALALIADLLLALAMMARVSGAAVVIVEDGVVEFRRDGRAVAAYIVASGRGHQGRAALEAALESRRARYRGRPTPPCGALVGGTSDAWNAVLTPPRDIVWGNSPDDDTVSGQTELPLIHLGQLRADPRLIEQLVP